MLHDERVPCASAILATTRDTRAAVLALPLLQLLVSEKAYGF